MSLAVAYNTARSSLQASLSQMALVSRNTAGANDPAYSRKIGALVTQDGAARVVVLRASDRALLNKMLETTSGAATQKSLLEGLKQISQTIGDPELDVSPTARIGAMTDALKLYANAPDDLVRAKGFLKSAQDLASSLNQATSTLNSIRQETQTKITDSVARINDILAKFKLANDEVISGAALGRDVSDAMDTRDHLIAQLSEEVGVTVSYRAGNDIALYTDSGVPLFDRLPRTVRYDASVPLAAGKPGGAILIDDIPVTGANSPMPLNSGNLVGLVKLRDDVAVTYQRQLDEVARGLIQSFAEKDPSALGPDLAGIFTYSGTTLPGMPALAGLAGLIKVNDAIDPSKPGGDLLRIRDGIGYGYNTTGAASYSGRLNQLIGKVEADQGFAPGLGVGTSMSLQGFASASAGWLEDKRQDSSQQLSYQETLLSQASDSLSNATDVNRDEETALMMQLEKSYSAAAKLLSVIDQMLKTLLSTLG